jgi:hypothetical protein
MTSPMVPVISPEGQPGQIPQENLSAAIGRGFQTAVRMTSPEGQSGWIPQSNAAAALSRGFKVGQPAVQSQSQSGALSTAAREFSLGAAAGAGLPETQHASDFSLLPGLKQIVTHPVDSAKLLGGAIGGAQTGQLRQAAEAAKEIPGNLTDSNLPWMQRLKAAGANAGLAWTHAQGGLLPLIGPAAVGAGTEIGQGIQGGDIASAAHGVGQAAGLLGTLALGTRGGQAMAGKALEGVKAPIETAGNYLTKALGGGAETMARQPLPASQGAAGAATNADLASFAKSKGIDLTPGQATGEPALQTIQAIGERAVVGKSGAALRQHLLNQKLQFSNALEDFKDRMSPSAATPDTESIGNNIKSQVYNAQNELKAAAQRDFEAFRQGDGGNMRVDLTAAKQAMPARLEKFGLEESELPPVVRKALGDQPVVLNGQQTLPSQLPPQVRAVLGLDTPDVARAQTIRSNLLDIARDHPDGRIRAFASQAAKDVDTAIANSANQAGVGQQYRAANAKWKHLAQNYYDPSSPLSKVLNQPDGTKIPNQLLASGKEGGSPAVLRQLHGEGIDLSPLKRQVIQNIEENGFHLTSGGTRLGQYSPAFLKTLFAPGELAELQNYGRISRAIKYEVNPSGTSNVVQGERQLHGILSRSASALTGPTAAWLTMKPGFKAAMAPPGSTQLAIGGAPLSSLQPPPSPPSVPAGILPFLQAAQRRSK